MFTDTFHTKVPIFEKNFRQKKLERQKEEYKKFYNQKIKKLRPRNIDDSMSYLDRSTITKIGSESQRGGKFNFNRGH